jgi:hypothetical protein
LSVSRECIRAANNLKSEELTDTNYILLRQTVKTEMIRNSSMHPLEYTSEKAYLIAPPTSAEAGAIMTLAPSGARGKYLALWIVSRNLGQLVGSNTANSTAEDEVLQERL